MNRIPQGWTASQRRVLIGAALVMLGYLTLQMIRNPQHVSDPQPLAGPRASDLADRIDPNTATAQELAALPVLGEKRAAAVITYREAFVASNPARRAFESADDLTNIKGIGPAMVANLEPFLTFSVRPAASQP